MAEDGSMTYTPSPPRFRVVLPDLSQVLDDHLSAPRRREKVQFAPFASVLGEDEPLEAKAPLRDTSREEHPPRKSSTVMKYSKSKSSTPIAQNKRDREGPNTDRVVTTQELNPRESANETNIDATKELDTSTSFSVESFPIENSQKRSSTVSEPFGFILGLDEKENSTSRRESIATVDDEAEVPKPRITTSYAKPVDILRTRNKVGNQKDAKKTHFGGDWNSNIQEAKRIRELVESKRRKGIELKRQLDTRLTQKRVNDKMSRRHEILEKVEEEVKFKSRVHQDHQKTLRDQAEENRRKSIAKRDKIRENRLKGAQKLHMMRIEEDNALYEERYEASMANRSFKADLAHTRRESLAMRSDQAAFVRKKVQKAAQEDRNRQHESFELKFAAAKDVEAHLEDEKRKTRKSIADRNAVARSRRQKLAQEEADHSRKEQEMFELELMADRDVSEYKQSLKSRDRMSLAHRGLEARRRRIKEEQLRAIELEKEHESYELTWAGKRDAENHLKKLQRLQREDLALQNSEKRRKARVMDELRQLEREKEAESYVLKRAGEKDAERYLTKLAEDRRKSLQLRGVQMVQERQVEKLQRQEELQKQHEDEELKAAAQKDVEAYREACKERDRLSLQYRQKEARRKRLQEKNEADQQLERDHESFELQTQDRKKVEEYVNECKQRRRMSLAYRAKEKKRHARWKQQQRQKEIAQQRRKAHQDLMDKHYQELARHEERMRLTQEAIRHASREGKHRLIH